MEYKTLYMIITLIILICLMLIKLIIEIIIALNEDSPRYPNAPFKFALFGSIFWNMNKSRWSRWLLYPFKKCAVIRYRDNEPVTVEEIINHAKNFMQ